MNHAEFVSSIEAAIASAPVAPKIPKRSIEDVNVDYWKLRLLNASTAEGKLHAARKLNAARRARGDFDHLLEAVREHLDKPGERYD
jgi:hypothetical protein